MKQSLRFSCDPSLVHKHPLRREKTGTKTSCIQAAPRVPPPSRDTQETAGSTSLSSAAGGDRKHESFVFSMKMFHKRSVLVVVYLQP